MRVAHLPQRHGINQIDVPRHERGERGLGIVTGEFPQKAQVIIHLSSIHLRRRGKVTDYFSGGRSKLDLPLQPKYFSAMQYNVVMVESEEGFAVSCPALPGCHSQGATHDEALANIREAIQLWLEVAEEDAGREAAAEGGRFTRELVTV
jgi:predicted RNase H-like HicB family nuclease